MTHNALFLDYWVASLRSTLQQNWEVLTQLNEGAGICSQQPPWPIFSLEISVNCVFRMVSLLPSDNTHSFIF